jgi:DNA-binding Lrp family transcriptional regulator
MVDETDKRVIGLIQGDIPLCERPFKELAAKVGISEDAFVERIRDLKKRGVIRRFGATLRHQEAGYSANAMSAWRVPEERADEVGKIIAGFREVTHCYRRRPHPKWPYNLYAMIHGRSEEDCRLAAERMSKLVGIDNYVLLFSAEEFKKTSMEYF